MDEMHSSGIREDGTIEGVVLETHYRPLEYVTQDDRGWLRVVCDVPGAYAETRIPFRILENLGWKREGNG